ncbi:alpha-beta hydrolase superfamily lysophospholipase [Arthrobacter pascens]|uniref:alpha/beta hydrolase n=1 Tax=Arthrobacter pascens TaxID=1677 RepID=UPI00277D72CF|nr:alpha/beta hydrolase [Arthrobacter pascens]MDQ0633860.1 alpha-beta hydrolase superfamily lysophospholipase [Arthrobacter pascens]
MKWEPDILGEGFEACTFQASGADGVQRTATLVRFRMPAEDPLPSAGRRRRTVLFLHGWSDYFFNVDLAKFWTRNGYEFYALDMHNHGRSLRTDSPGGYVADLADYDAEISKAIGILGADRRLPKSADLDAADSASPPGQAPLLILMGHSTGGLVAALWAGRHAGVASQLVLNSPWLEMHGSALVRRAASKMVGPVARFRPEAVIRLPERGFYWRTISSSAEGEWALDDRFRPPMAFPLRAGWLSAVLSGQAKVARGLGIEIPILVLLSRGSANGPFWSEEMRRTDAVLDVNTIALRALTLGRTVTVERIDGALHDVFLSPSKVRADAYARLTRWLRGYADPGAWDDGAASTAPP